MQLRGTPVSSTEVTGGGFSSREWDVRVSARATGPPVDGALAGLSRAALPPHTPQSLSSPGRPHCSLQSLSRRLLCLQNTLSPRLWADHITSHVSPSGVTAFLHMSPTPHGNLTGAGGKTTSHHGSLASALTATQQVPCCPKTASSPGSTAYEAPGHGGGAAPVSTQQDPTSQSLGPTHRLCGAGRVP